MSEKMIKAHIRLVDGLRRALADREGQRGDVPGWVLITIMTAGLVSAIWFIADERLKSLIGDALDEVSPSGN
ncbi:hypothetical protein [Nostocoides australiense]|uniref:Uncharacterized protein n=1 Tax=Nostocoides australiense Ben110 TaxID=1193182 RepID=W6JV40_9MICO|nr:hypothetical protein [Tetrasphaera australiensis]CCH72847.1 conserved hypothetical protein [Tetrasphaera australiensis Ben110]HPF82378.1 hypothetical protein [Tetrasphaera australiensis]HRW02593.1 hypothetical protein [Tetrasphaera sp.]